MRFINEKQDDKHKETMRKINAMIYEVSWMPSPQQLFIYN